MSDEITTYSVDCPKCHMSMTILPMISETIDGEGYFIILWDPTVIEHSCAQGSMRQGSLCETHGPNAHASKGKLPAEPKTRQIVNVELPE